MLIEVDKDAPFVLAADGAITVAFASASSVGDAARMSVFFNGELVDRVTLSAPHSWWPATGQAFCPPLAEGDELRVEASAAVDLRIDIH